MVKLIAVALSFIALNLWAQSSKSIETEVDKKEERVSREQWDSEEAEAQAQEDVQRRRDEEAAKRSDLELRQMESQRPQQQ